MFVIIKATFTLICVCRFRTIFWDSVAKRFARFSWTSISFRSPSIFFFNLMASLRDFASASRVACMDSMARWWLRLEKVKVGKVVKKPCSIINNGCIMKWSYGKIIVQSSVFITHRVELTEDCRFPHLSQPASCQCLLWSGWAPAVYVESCSPHAPEFPDTKIYRRI